MILNVVCTFKKNKITITKKNGLEERLIHTERRTNKYIEQLSCS